ncbi:MAG: methylated-DNA--[protein]-cysteine S-methyltransferase [Planctomycetes bacterium]|nr:methylated-DNA--[protein]-cysteine S-methyltransferase [Planctomycetota bacterium]
MEAAPCIADLAAIRYLPIPTELGTVWVAGTAAEICDISLPGTRKSEFVARLPRGASPGETPTLASARRQLEEYFAGRRRTFDLPLRAHGTEFEKRVLRALAQIPYGTVATYGELAARAGSPGAARAIGRVMARNRIPIVLPCHRVVAASGLGGFAGAACLLDVKRALLEREGAAIPPTPHKRPPRRAPHS